MQNTPFWRGTNFWFNVAMFLGAFWGLKSDTANVVLAAVVGGIGAIGLIRQFVSTAKFGGILPTLKQGNTLTYLANALTLIGIPMASELVGGLGDLTTALVTQNWGLAIAAAFTVVNTLIYIFKNKGGGTAATANA